MMMMTRTTCSMTGVKKPSLYVEQGLMTGSMFVRFGIMYHPAKAPEHDTYAPPRNLLSHNHTSQVERVETACGGQ
jgi:hypothetical protein